MRTLRSLVGLVCLAVVVPVFASGCSENVKTGAGDGTPGDDDDDGTPGDDDDDDDGGTYVPPVVPDAIGGTFSIGNIRSQGNDPPAGIGGSGLFFTQPIPIFFKEPYEALFSHYEDRPLDSCDWGYGASINMASDGQISQNAGDVKLATPAGSGNFFFLPLGGLQLYIAQSMTGVFMTDGAPYTLSGTGAEVGAFSTTMQGPPDVHVTTPSNLTSPGPIPISRSQSMPLTWESENDGTPLFLFLLSFPTQDATPQVVVCKMEDDGEFEVPASAFQLIPETAFGVKDRLQILKYRIHTFTANGAPGPIMVNFASGYDVETTFGP